MGLHPTKLEKMARSAVILRKKMVKRHVAAGTNSLSTTNEKRTTQAQRNLLKREQSKPEHQATKRYVEVGISDSTGNKLTISLSTAAAYIHPAAADNPGWMRWSPVNHASVVPWRRRAPQSPSSSSFGAPQGNNKIYKSDEVFLIEESQKKRHKPNVDSL